MPIFNPEKLLQACENKTYTLDDAVKIARIAQATLKDHNFHVTLGGSCLTKGVSSKDIDLFIYPHNDNTTFMDENNINKLVDILSEIGFDKTTYDRTYHTEPQDGRIVHVTTFMGSRVDIFFMQRFKVKH